MVLTTSQHSVVLEQGIDSDDSVVELRSGDDPSNLFEKERKRRSERVDTSPSLFTLLTHHSKHETGHGSDGASHSVGFLPGEGDGDGNDARSEKRTLRGEQKRVQSVNDDEERVGR